MSCCCLRPAPASTCLRTIRTVVVNSRHWFMPYRRDVQSKGGAVLSNGASISGDSGASMVPDQPTVEQATGGGGPHASSGHHDPRIGGTRHGVQRERYRGGQQVSGFGVLSEAANRLAYVRFAVDASRVANRLHVLEKTLYSDVGLHVVATRYGAGPVDRRGGQGGTALVAVGIHLGAAGRNGQARGRHLSGRIPDQERRQDHVVSRWASAGPDRDRTLERIGVAGAGSWDGRGAWTDHGRDVFSSRGAPLPSHGVRALRDSSRVSAGPWVHLSPPKAHDVSGSMEGCVGQRVPNHAVILVLRQRRSIGSGIGRRQAEALLPSGGAYGLCFGAGWRRTGTRRQRGW